MTDYEQLKRQADQADREAIAGITGLMRVLAGFLLGMCVGMWLAWLIMLIGG